MLCCPSKYEPKKCIENKKQAELTKTAFVIDRGIHYKINGSGRDTYIYNDNGGFCKMYQPNQYDKATLFFPNLKKTDGCYQAKRPYLQSHTVYYRSDGTGRDVYIL